MNATRWRPVLTVALFSVLPFAVFLNTNRADLDPDAGLGLYALTLLVPGLAALVITGWAAAGGVALELQRRAAGEHREQHPQARVLPAAGVQEGEPGGLHLLDRG